MGQKKEIGSLLNPGVAESDCQSPVPLHLFEFYGWFTYNVQGDRSFD